MKQAFLAILIVILSHSADASPLSEAFQLRSEILGPSVGTKTTVTLSPEFTPYIQKSMGPEAIRQHEQHNRQVLSSYSASLQQTLEAMNAIDLMLTRWELTAKLSLMSAVYSSPNPAIANVQASIESINSILRDTRALSREHAGLANTANGEAAGDRGALTQRLSGVGSEATHLGAANSKLQECQEQVNAGLELVRKTANLSGGIAAYDAALAGQAQAVGAKASEVDLAASAANARIATIRPKLDYQVNVAKGIAHQLETDKNLARSYGDQSAVINQRNAEMQREQAKIPQLQARRDTVRSQISSLKGQVASAPAWQTSSIRYQISALEGELRNVESEVARTEGNINGLKGEIQRFAGLHAAFLRQENSAFQTAINGYRHAQADLRNLDPEIDALSGEVTAESARVVEFCSYANSFTQALRSNPKARLLAFEESLENEIESARKDAHGLIALDSRANERVKISISSDKTAGKQLRFLYNRQLTLENWENLAPAGFDDALLTLSAQLLDGANMLLATQSAPELSLERAEAIIAIQNAAAGIIARGEGLNELTLSEIADLVSKLTFESHRLVANTRISGLEFDQSELVLFVDGQNATAVGAADAAISMFRTSGAGVAVSTTLNFAMLQATGLLKWTWGLLQGISAPFKVPTDLAIAAFNQGTPVLERFANDIMQSITHPDDFVEKAYDSYVEGMLEINSSDPRASGRAFGGIFSGFVASLATMGEIGAAEVGLSEGVESSLAKTADSVYAQRLGHQMAEAIEANPALKATLPFEGSELGTVGASQAARVPGIPGLKYLGKGEWVSEQGLVYRSGIRRSGETDLRHLFKHCFEASGEDKVSHSIFNVSPREIPKLIDEAWLKRGAPIPGDDGVYVVEMGRSIGTRGETSIRIITRQGNRLVTAYPQ